MKRFRTILRIAKRRAAEEGRPLSNLIQIALARYRRKASATSKERKNAYKLFCAQPMKITSEQLRYVLEEDMW